MAELRLTGKAFQELTASILAAAPGCHIKIQCQGFSMSPFILDNDTVTLGPVAQSGKIRLGDIIAVADPDDGRIIIHRVIRKKKGYIQTKGDNNRTPDAWFPPERVIGVVKHIDIKRWTPYRSFRWQNILIALLSRTGLSNRVISPAATALWNFIR